MEAIQTANGMYNYSQEFYGVPLDTWVQNTHKYNCEANKWDYRPLKKGAFGYDNLAVSIGNALSKYEPDREYSDAIYTSLYKVPRMIYLRHPSKIYWLCHYIHEGWSMNYIYWRDNSPEKSTEYKYYAPFNPINDERRNHCAVTEFVWLSKEEMDKDEIIAEFLHDEIERLKKTSV